MRTSSAQSCAEPCCPAPNPRGANLRRADLLAASLRRAKLDTDFTQANVRYTSLAETSIEGAIFDDCEIYGIAAWNLAGTLKSQANLVIRASARSI